MNVGIEQPITKNKPSRAGGFLLYGLSLLLIANSLTYHNSRIGKIILILTGVLIFITTVIVLLQRGSFNKKYLLGVFGILVGGINTIINGSGFGSILTYANLIMMLLYFSLFSVTPRQKDNMFNLIIISILIVLITYSNQNEINTLYYSIIPGNTDQSINPNTVGILYFFLFIYAIFKINKMPFSLPLRCFVKIVIFGIILYLSLDTGARTSVMAMCLFFLADFFNFIPPKYNSNTLKSLYVFGLIVTLVFTFFYMYLHQVTDGTFEIFGKNLFTGREVVWQEAYDILKDNWLFGYDNSYAFFNGRVQSAHNSLLGIWFVLGIIPLICCIKHLSDGFLSVAKSSNSRTTMIALFACLFIMTFETLLSDDDLYIYFALLFVLSNEERGYDT